MKERNIRKRRERSSGSPASSKRKYEEGLPITNKKQILGFFLVLFSILIILSIISYSGIDQSRLESFNIADVLKKENQSQNFTTSNWLGITGVLISGFFVESAFGFFSIIIPALLIIYGILLLRKKQLSDVMQLSVYALLLMIIFSALFGMFRITIGPENVSYSLVGRSGEYLSSVLYLLAGSLGSYVILFFLSAGFIFLLIDRDIVKSFARMKLILESIREKFRDYLEEMKERRAEEKKRIESGTFDKEEKPVKVKKEKVLAEPVEEEHVIKDTKINRPDGNTMITDEPVDVKKKEIILDEKSAEKLKIEKIAPVKEGLVSAAGENGKTNDNGSIIKEELKEYKLPTLSLLDEPLKEELELISDEELKENGKLLQAKLLHFDVKIEKVIATPGPVVTLYELIPAEDVKLSKIESLQDDIALAMKARGIRMIIPIPGKGTVGVEIPNHKPCMVKIKSTIASKKFNESSYQLPIALGKTISGEVFIDDLAKMPHLLIAGSTGSGKSVGINTIITSLLYKLQPTDLKFVLIDPKKIELNLYSKLKNHFLAVTKDIKETIVTTPQNAVMVLKSLELEMEKRYERLANATVRNIADYNKKVKAGTLKDDENVKHGKMPYIVVIIDELADLMITAAKEVEEPIARLAQLARAVGIHLILATQRPSVDVITGVIKANFSARIAYLVNSKVDSRTILDMNGAEQLLGNGDMLYLPPGVGKPLRIQNPFISSEEVEKIAEYISRQAGFTREFELPSVLANRKKAYSSTDDRDELFEDAARLIVRYQQGSVSLLQRRLKVGYARAARIVDELEAAGVVGPFDGGKAREVLVETEAQLEQLI
ncbi:MAG: DNA translocase FtsK [Ignavibacteriae bacterium]|nr:MAG: DNA translocase FtsK [Ignavibacteriota bacterium]